MISEKVLICGIVKNVSSYIKSSLKLCEMTGALFDDYRIIIYENNSTDDTKRILSSYNELKYKIISEDIPMEKIRSESKSWAYTKITGSDHPCRIEQIANARNKVLDEINKSEYDSYTYVIWVDLDTDYWSVEGIANAFNIKDTWDVLYANGVDYSRSYYDFYALRMNEYAFGPEIVGDIFWKQNDRKKFTIKPSNNELIPVVSAFGGIGIFKKQIFQNFRYDCIVNDEVKKYYRQYLDKNNLDNETERIISNECKKFAGGHKDELYDIYWKCNSGYDNVVVCEHVCINMALHNAGYRIFILPCLLYLHH